MLLTRYAQIEQRKTVNKTPVKVFCKLAIFWATIGFGANFTVRAPKCRPNDQQRGDQGKFFKNRAKSSLRLKGPKALWRKWHYPLNSMQLKTKNWGRFWREKRLKECPNCQVMAIFAWSPKTRIF